VGAGQVAYANGVISNGAFITTRYNAMATAAPSGNITGLILGTNDPGTGGADGGDWSNTTFTLINQGAGSITSPRWPRRTSRPGPLCHRRGAGHDVRVDLEQQHLVSGDLSTAHAPWRRAVGWRPEAEARGRSQVRSQEPG